MKALLVFLLGAVVGAFAYHLYREEQARPALTRAADGTRDAARDTRDAVNGKLRDWNLTPDDIRADLARGGEVVRSKAAVAGERLGDARIVTVLKAKYVLDRDLSALDINVDVVNGRVTLTGRVGSPALIGHAVALALDTDGVQSVVSRLTVATP